MLIRSGLMGPIVRPEESRKISQCRQGRDGTQLLRRIIDPIYHLLAINIFIKNATLPYPDDGAHDLYGNAVTSIRGAGAVHRWDVPKAMHGISLQLETASSTNL